MYDMYDVPIEYDWKTYEWVGKPRFISFWCVQGYIDAGELKLTK